jgi:hypothetical protein
MGAIFYENKKLIKNNLVTWNKYMSDYYSFEEYDTLPVGSSYSQTNTRINIFTGFSVCENYTVSFSGITRINAISVTIDNIARLAGYYYITSESSVSTNNTEYQYIYAYLLTRCEGSGAGGASANCTYATSLAAKNTYIAYDGTNYSEDLTYCGKVTAKQGEPPELGYSYKYYNSSKNLYYLFFEYDDNTRYGYIYTLSE